MGKIKKGAIRKRRTIVLILIGSLVVILGVAVWWYLTRSTDPNADQLSTQDVTEMNEVGDIIIEGRRFIDQKDTKGGAEQYDAALQSTKDDEVTLQLLLAKSSYYIEANEIDKALETAKDADKRYPGNVAVYVALARAYEAKNARAEAIAEYRRAIAIFGDDKPADTSAPAASRADPKAFYENRIKELEQ